MNEGIGGNALPLVTVVIPTIGRPQYMPETVASVLAQDYPNLEVIISDNCPEVPTRSFISAEQQRRVHIIERPVRLTFSTHFNACLADATGEFVLFVSDDDLIEPGYVSSLIAEVLARPAITMCLGQQVIVNANFRAKDMPRPDAGATQYFNGDDFLASWLGKSERKLNVTTFIAMFARKTDLIDAGGFKEYPDGSHADNFLTISLVLQGVLAVTSAKYYYRVHTTSFGLTTPFERLLRASEMFMADVRRLLGKHRARISFFRRLHTFLLVRSMCTMTMHYRLKSIYRRQMKIIEYMLWELSVAKFMLGI